MELCESVVHLVRSEQEGDNPDRNWNWKDPNYTYSPTRSAEVSVPAYAVILSTIVTIGGGLILLL